MISNKLLLACVLFAIGQTFGWFHLNSQFKWGWWKDKPFAAIATFMVPAGLCFWWGVKIAYAEMSEVWGPRFLVFSMSYLTFPILTWWLLGESMFTARTMICVFLSFMIVFVQFYGR